jgi:hypothetical protein
MGQVVKWKISRSWIARWLFVGYTLVTFYSYFPNLLAYTNELLWNKTRVYKVLASANIDVGQARYSMETYLKKNPGCRIPGSLPAAGHFILGINDYLDLKQTGRYTWIQDFEPYSHVNHCYLLFDIREQDLVKKIKEKN